MTTTTTASHVRALAIHLEIKYSDAQDLIDRGEWLSLTDSEANSRVYTEIGTQSDMAEFVDYAIREYGRGHFIAHYDGQEHEQAVEGVKYYLYRLD